MPDVGHFTGLTQLELQAGSFPDAELDDNDWNEDGADLDQCLLQHLPHSLESLKLARFHSVHLKPPAAPDRAAQLSAHGAQAAASLSRLPPAITRLEIAGSGHVGLAAPLPSLAQLAISRCFFFKVSGEGLSLPQLTSLQLAGRMAGVHLHCGAMPALAQLESSSIHLAAEDSFAALRQVTRMRLVVARTFLRSTAELLAGVSASLRSLTIRASLADMGLAAKAAQVLAAAGTAQLTYLVR